MKLSNFFRMVKEKKEKILIIFVGVFVNSVLLTYVYDYVFYPFMIWKLGVVKGGIIMIFLSTFVCYLLLLFYDWTKKDWLGIEAIKHIKDYGGNSRIGRAVSWVLKKGDFGIMVLLSIQFDPFITTAYMRRGSGQYNGLSKRDWKIFFSSAVIANVYWTLMSFAGVSLIEYLWWLFK